MFLWRASARFESDKSAARTLYRRVRFMLQSVPLRRALRRFLAAASKGSLGKLLKFRPETIGAAIVWPFQCIAWDGPERLARIQGHFAAVDRLGPPLDFAADEKLVLLDAGEFMEGVRIVLDQPPWFMREGQLTLSLFHQDFRAFSLVFSLWDGPDGLEALIGAVQGRSSPHALALYRDMTKAFQGARPRDLLIELFRMLCRELGVGAIHAVSDACRIHRDPYFGPKKGSQILVDYDEIWEERGGRRLSEAFFELPLESQQRAIEDIPAKRRAMYRKRYEMLEKIETELRARFWTLRPVRFDES